MDAIRVSGLLLLRPDGVDRQFAQKRAKRDVTRSLLPWMRNSTPWSVMKWYYFTQNFSLAAFDPHVGMAGIAVHVPPAARNTRVAHQPGDDRLRQTRRAVRDRLVFLAGSLVVWHDDHRPVATSEQLAGHLGEHEAVQGSQPRLPTTTPQRDPRPAIWSSASAASSGRRSIRRARPGPCPPRRLRRPRASSPGSDPAV
jgi:hypothetical protein